MVQIVAQRRKSDDGSAKEFLRECGFEAGILC